MKKLFLLGMAIFSFVFNVAAEGGYTVGSTASNFKLKNIDGLWVALSDYPAAKGFIITFTCNHCPFAKAYEDRIIALDKKYADMGYPVIAINPNDALQHPEDSFDSMKVRSNEKGFTFPYLYDETQKTAETYGATRTPHVYIVRKEGDNLVVKYIGAIDDNWEDPSAVQVKYVEAAVDALLAGQPIAVTSTKAVGCTIKWKAKE